jgi:Cytochrome P460
MKLFFVMVVASVSSLALAAGLNGLPKNIVGFEKWKVVAQNLDTGGPHAGENKKVFANVAAAKVWKGKNPLSVGSLIVKTAGSVSSPSFVAIMKKTSKGWDYAEYTPNNGKYSLIGSGTSCSGCHENAKANDYLFSRIIK